jgi:uncharacterized protein
VWEALNDPKVLVRTIPGCERLEATGPDAYSMTVTAGVASIKGTYAGNVALSDQQHPNSFLMRASGAGGPGTVSADVKVTLADEGGTTRLTYDADAVIGGVIGGVGQRMLAGVAKKMAGEFFAQVDDVLIGKGVPPAAVAEQASSGEPSAFVAPAKIGRIPALSADGGFLLGTIVGAAIALLGVLVGSRSSRSARRIQ